jgi:hypothetical protein
VKLKDLKKLIFASMPIETSLKLQNIMRMGRPIDLKNPKSFNDKIQYRKLHDTNPLLALCSDKVLAKDYVAERIGSEHVIPTLWHGKTLPPRSERDWARPYVLKANHMSGGNAFIRPGEDVNWDEVEHLAAAWMAQDYRPDLFERHYDQIERQLLVEPLIGESCFLNDYKFHVFNGKVQFIIAYTGRGKDIRAHLATPDWETIDCSYYTKRPDTPPPRPASLSAMIDIAEELGRDFCFVRVDLYENGGTPLFGEMTFMPGSGYRRFEPQSYDHYFGSFWDVSRMRKAA